MVVVVRRDRGMGKGKVCAQVAHAVLEVYKEAKKRRKEWVEAWEREGGKKIVLRVDSMKELLDLYEKAKKRVPAVLIRDAGLTQVPPGTVTALGAGPGPDEVMDEIFGGLKLL